MSSGWVAGEERTRDVCLRCGRIHYDNPKVLVGIIVHWRDRIVLCRRATDPAKGCWNVPMGFLEQGESLEEAGVRELREETGLHVAADALSLCTVCSLPYLDQVHMVYRAELFTQPIFVAGEESLEVQLFSEADLPFPEIAYADLLTDQFHHFFRQLRNKNFQVVTMTLRGP